MNSNLTHEQIRDGFWYYRPEKNWPPKPIHDINQIENTKYLNLCITQLNMNSYRQKKHIDELCEYIPTLKDAKFIWFNTRVNQKMFDTVCQLKSLKGLYVKWSVIKHIDQLENFHLLEHFHLGSSSQVENINVLSKIQSLITLELENLKRITDFSTLENLSGLEGLAVEGSMWTTQLIDSLQPIGNLRNLRYFHMTNSRLSVKNFDPLLNLKQLNCFYSSWNYPLVSFKNSIHCQT